MTMQAFYNPANRAEQALLDMDDLRAVACITAAPTGLSVSLHFGDVAASDYGRMDTWLLEYLQNAKRPILCPSDTVRLLPKYIAATSLFSVRVTATSDKGNRVSTSGFDSLIGLLSTEDDSMSWELSAVLEKA